MRFVLGVCLALAGAQPLAAQGVGVIARAGTSGIGGGVVLGLTPSLNMRAEATWLGYSAEGLEIDTEHPVSVSGDGTLLLGSFLADWHPGGGAFRLSVGAVYNGSEGRGTIEPLEPLRVGARVYTTDELGSITGDVKPGLAFAPYAGIGFGNGVRGRVGFMLDVGALYLGSPQVDLTATGMLTPTEQEAGQIQENLGWVQWYPVVSLGLSLRVR